jgi:nucleoside-diphosphate-sugar epimerase
MVSKRSDDARAGTGLTDGHGQRVVVGGGCGLFGSYLVPVIVRTGARVTVVDNLDGGDRAALDPVRDDVTLVEADLRDRATCDAVLRDCDLFVNLAATASGIGFSRTHHGQMLIDNVLCGLVPLQSAQRNGVRHVVTISTSCVYPDDAPVPTPELDAFIGEPEHVNEGYGWAKRIQELACRYVAQEHGLRTTILRPFNLYGGNYPWRSSERAHVIPSLVKRVLDGEDPLIVWGSGEQRRNFLHGADAAEVAWRVITSGADGPVNIGYEEDTRIADLVTLVCEVTGRHPRVIFDTSRPDGQARKSADSTRLRALTGNYTPRISLRAGIEDMVGWYHRAFPNPPRLA